MKKPLFSQIIRLAAAGLALLLPALVWADTAKLAGDSFINPGDGTNYGSLPTVNVGGATASWACCPSTCPPCLPPAVSPGRACAYTSTR